MYTLEFNDKFCCKQEIKMLFDLYSKVNDNASLLLKNNLGQSTAVR